MNCMSYEEFNERILEDTTNIATEILGPEAKVYIQGAENPIPGAALIVRYSYAGSKYMCGFELRQVYEAYRRKPVWAELIRAFREKFKEAKKFSGESDLEFLDSFETAKERLLLSPVPFKKREETETEICVMMDDIPMAVHFVISDDDTKQTIGRLQSDFLKHWKVSEEEVLAAAMENQMKIDKPVFKSMREINPLMKILISEQEDELMWVGTTESHRYGAVVISYPGYLDSVCEKIGADVFIYPVSVHSVVFIKDDYLGKELICQRDDFVKLVNKRELDGKDILSDKVYHYERATQTFESAKAWYQRVHGFDL